MANSDIHPLEQLDGSAETAEIVESFRSLTNDAGSSDAASPGAVSPDAESTETISTDAAPSNAPYPWILHPVLDLAFGCGGIVWLLFAIHTFILNQGGVIPQALVSMSAIGVIVFAETHTASTFLVVYRNADVRSKFAFYTKWLALACVLLALAGMTIPGVTPILVKIYLLMVPHHFIAQTFGIAMLYCMKRGYKLSNWERETIKFFLRSVTWFAVLRQLTFQEWSGTSFLTVPIPFWGPLPIWMCTASEYSMLFSAALLCVLVLVRTVRTGEMLPVPVQLTILTGVSAFVLGPVATGFFWLYVSAYYHGAQYLMVVTAQRIKENGLPEGMPASKIAGQLFRAPALRFLAMTALVSFGIYTCVPQALLSTGIDFAMSAAVIFTTVNFFHIITDGAIWKLRDPKVRAQLVA